MLQVKRAIVLRFVCLCIIAYSPCSAEQQVDWLLEDALKEEYTPLLQTDVVSPADVSRALRYYENGNYRYSARILERMRDLYLPDGRLDFICFALAECYRQLSLVRSAVENYRSIAALFSTSSFAPPSYFRLLEYAYDERNSALADSIVDIFKTQFANHSLYFSSLYVRAKLFYREGNYRECHELLTGIAPQSSVYCQAQFLSALCCLKTKEPEKSLLFLDYIRKNCLVSEALVSEATILMGDIYYNKGENATALTHYSAVPHSAKRYSYSFAKTLRIYLDMGQYEKTRAMAKSFIAANKNSEFLIEILSILEHAYARLKDYRNRELVKSQIARQLKTARFSFQVYDELGHVADLVRQCEILKISAIQTNNEALMKSAMDHGDKIADLKRKLRGMMEPSQQFLGYEQYSKMAERRYLDILNKQMERVQDSIKQMQSGIDSLTKNSTVALDSAGKAETRLLTADVDSAKIRLTALNREYAAVIKECFGYSGQHRQDEEMQAKYVDWAFIRYMDAKTDLVEMNKEVIKRAQAKAEGKKDAVKSTSPDVVRLFSEVDISIAGKELEEERNRLITQIVSILYSYPTSDYTPSILFRLAELYNDRAGDEFDVQLREYEKKMAQGAQGLIFPEFHCGDVIATYNKIIKEFPKNNLADNACFYKALALQKLGRFDEANEVLLDLTKKYPESEFYVEANMNIARYYFEHPKIQGGKGYKLAEEAYHRVLYYRDHPQFVSALYNLGWCYYMQNQYDEAIAVFKYLVEEVALDFDVTKIDDKMQVTNPLLRDEAIDYIAISFDQENHLDDAVKFLTFIGNIDYAAMVLKRLAELREEDMDYNTAVTVYSRLLKEYPQSISAPDASLGIIKMFELLNKRDEAFLERERFFKKYAKNGEWQLMVWKRDSLLIPRVDSIAVSMGQFIADEYFRNAEKNRDTATYSKAAQCYEVLVKTYPDKKQSVNARWNLAVILETKLNRSLDAFDAYRNFSKSKSVDLEQREQSALNAIAIAQKLLPPDSLVKEGIIDSAAGRLIEAVAIYQECFPNGKNCISVLLTAGSVYFNRKMYEKAAEYFELIAKKGEASKTDEYYDAMFLLAQCHFGREQWESASKLFETVWKNSSNDLRRNEAYKFLLQSEFSRAKQFMTLQSFKEAAQAFISIEDRFPNSEYGDAVLFKSSECFEKIEKWTEASESYMRLAKVYPKSKLAPSALFNAAADFEKAGKYDNAAEAYEILASNYPESDKTKDALFNLGLCYEKVGNADKVAEANERYTRMFPGEKDVESMLMRTAEYYRKANLTAKAVTIYRNFIRQFPQSPKSVEALFMIGKMYRDRNDRENAALNFQQAEQQHIKLVSSGTPGNPFFAAEAAYYIGKMKQEEFSAIQFVFPEAKFKADQKMKTSLLVDATKTFERVIKYQSEKMFEAAYWIGQMYEDFSATWKKQERPKLDPIKAAVLEKDIAQVGGTILQKSFIPYKKAIELSVGFDSVSTEQKMWVQKTKVSLARNLFSAGVFMNDAIFAMQNAPIPGTIKNKPLYHYQYLKQLLETLEPMRLQLRTYFLWAYKQLDSLKLLGENSKKCCDECSRVNYALGNEYDILCETILREPDVPKELSAAEREELSFQLEDIVFELQDKAMYNYEDAMKFLKREPALNNEFSGKILQSLAKLNPEKYGKSFYHRVVVATGKNWEIRCDSISGWNFGDVSVKGWKVPVEIPPVKSAIFPLGAPSYVWHDSDNVRDMYLRKHLFFNGLPRDAVIHLAIEGQYWLFVNKTLMSHDTSGTRQPDKRDSITGVAKLFKGGDNEVALHVRSIDSLSRGAAMVFSLLIDTTQHYTPDERYAQRDTGTDGRGRSTAVSGQRDTVIQKAKSSESGRDTAALLHKKEFAYDHVFKDRKEVLKAIEDYRLKTETFEKEMKKERLEIQRLRLRNDDLDAQITKIKEEIAELKKKSGSKKE